MDTGRSPPPPTVPSPSTQRWANGTGPEHAHEYRAVRWLSDSNEPVRAELQDREEGPATRTRTEEVPVTDTRAEDAPPAKDERAEDNRKKGDEREMGTEDKTTGKETDKKEKKEKGDGEKRG